VLKILNVNSSPLQLIYNWKAAANTVVEPRPIQLRKSLHNFRRPGAFIADFPIEK